MDNKPVKIERRPLEVLEALLRHVDEVMTKDELLDLVWPEVHTVENVVANAVAKLRKALGPDIGSRIVTHPRIGYRFSGTVERLAIGRKLVSSLKLKTGATIIDRPHYKLEQQISAAPSREVWRARHSKTQQSRIFKFASDGNGLASLKREVTLFRVLNLSKDKGLPVAKILDWNFKSEPFYIECEDAGVDLKTWSKTKGQLIALSDGARVELARDIADAVSQIHDAGILHRDLKPSNVIIVSDADNEKALSIRLIDFGSGKMREARELIDMGVSPMGFTHEMDDDTQLSTPLYMAPEIVQRQAHSIKSDIYSLGVMTYQILSGDIDKPMVTGWRNEINDPLLIADIINATQGTVSTRTSSAATLRDSLERIDQRRIDLQTAQALEAKATKAELALKRTQARRPWVYATGTALTIGLCVSLFFGFNAQIAKKNAIQSAANSKATSEFLKDVLISADPRTPAIGPNATVESSLKRAQSLIEERYTDDIDTQITIKETIAGIYAGLVDPKEIPLWQNIAQQAASYHGDRSDKARIATYRIAHALMRHGKYDEAETLIQDLESWPTSNNSDVIENALQAKGRLKLTQLKFKESIVYNEALNALLSVKAKPNLDVLHTARIDLAQSYSRDEGRKDEAVDLLKTLTDAPFNNGAISKWRNLEARILLGTSLIYAFRYQEAEPILLQGLEDVKEMYGEDSPKYLKTLGRLGELYAATNRRLDSAKIFGTMRELTCKKYGDDNIYCASYLANEGINYIDVGDYPLAEGKLRTAIQILGNQFGFDSPYVQVPSFHLATVLMETDKTQEAGTIISTLTMDGLKAGGPNARWDLLLGALQTRYEIRTNYSDASNSKLRSIVDELILIESEPTLIARTSSDLKR
ncbi:MAG: winged helix-turn-helix domain-containing protein [Maricaulaceae bacterium]